MEAQGEIRKAGMGAAESTPTALLTPAELASAATAAKIAVKAAKEEEGEGKEVKTEEGKPEMEEKKMNTEGGDANDILCTKSETPDEPKANKEEVGEGKGETTASAKDEVKTEEEVQPKVEKEEQEENKEEHGTEGEKTSKPTDDVKDFTEEKSLHCESSVHQKEIKTELQEHPESFSPEAQPGNKTTEEEDREGKENPESPKSLKSADTEKSPEEQDEERMDEDDKSEKSSQPESKKCLLLIESKLWIWFIRETMT